jgi:hypothetical protein
VEQFSRFFRTRVTSIVFADFFRRDGNQLRIALRKSIARDAYIVLEAGAHPIGVARQYPIHDSGLIGTDAGSCPCSVGQNALEFAQQHIEQVLFRRECTLYALPTNCAEFS